jgi:hypothetical protein
MPLTGRDLLDPMRLYRQHLPTILASHFHLVLSRTDLADRYLLCCQGLCPKSLTSRLLFGQVGILPKKMALCLTHTWIVPPHKYYGTTPYTAVIGLLFTSSSFSCSNCPQRRSSRICSRIAFNAHWLPSKPIAIFALDGSA